MGAARALCYGPPAHATPRGAASPRTRREAHVTEPPLPQKPAARLSRLLLAALVCGSLVPPGCGFPDPPPVDLLRASAQLAEAKVAGRDRTWVVGTPERPGQAGKHVRIGDDVRRVLPASPPSTLRYVIDVPPRAHLSLACGIDVERQDRGPVEFVVQAAKAGAPLQRVWSETLDPRKNAAHRRWVPVDVDLSAFAGSKTELVLETSAKKTEDDPKRAYWAVPAVTAPDAEAPLVIVYLVDTLRADHTQPYGYNRDTTPELLKFAQEAVVFETAIAQASWTKPSVASLMTSLLPGKHRAVQLRDPLDPGFVTMAEILENKGYATGAAIANSVIYSQGINFEQGFDQFIGMHGPEDRPSKLVEAGPVVDAGLAWLKARQGFPTFLYVHTMDPHVPYAPPAPFDQKYLPHPTPDHPGVDPRSDFKEPEDRERMIAQYDGDVAYGDQEFGRFIRTLKERGLFERALIVFLADHGEEFQDHGKWLHGRSVFDELVHVPLIVKFPGRAWAGQRVSQQVQVVDVLPTVLASQDLKVPPVGVIAGRPLQPVLQGKAAEPPALSEISHRGFVAHGIRTHDDKYVRRFSPEDDELYFDLTKDKKEQNSIAASAKDRVRELRTNLEQMMTPNPFRFVMRVSGPGKWEIKLRTSGWIEGVQETGFGPSEKVELEGNGRKVYFHVTPKPDAPREISFGARPISVPVWLEVTRDGKPVPPAQIWIGEEGRHPDALPMKMPNPEPEGESESPSRENVFAPPKDVKTGVELWLTPVPGASRPPELTPEQCEEMKTLGYVPSNMKCK